MKIRTLWKQWYGDGLELLFALDDNTCAENWQAWEDGVQAAIKRYDLTEADVREIMIEVPYGPILAAFAVPEVEGDVIG